MTREDKEKLIPGLNVEGYWLLISILFDGHIFKLNNGNIDS